MIKDAPITEPIQPMPPAWALWFQALVKIIKAILSIPAGRIPFGTGDGLNSSPDLTFDGTILRASQGRFGSSANYTEFTADGTMIFRGEAAVWNDVNISLVPPQGGAAAPAIIAFNGDANLDCYAFSGTNHTPDEVHSSLEVLHGYEEGTDIHFHIHTYPTDANTGDAKLTLRYAWFNRGTVPGAATSVPLVLPMPGVAWQETTFSWIIPGAGKTMGSRFVFSIFRDPTDPQDTYAHNLAFTDAGIHYDIDQVGSREILVK